MVLLTSWHIPVEAGGVFRFPNSVSVSIKEFFGITIKLNPITANYIIRNINRKKIGPLVSVIMKPPMMFPIIWLPI